MKILNFKSIYLVTLLSTMLLLSACTYNAAMKRETSHNTVLKGELANVRSRRPGLDARNKVLLKRKADLQMQIANNQKQINDSNRQINRINNKINLLKQQMKNQDQTRRQQLIAEKNNSEKELSKLKTKISYLKKVNRQKVKELEEYL